MHPTTLRAFIRFLGFEAKYAFNTVKDVVASGLKRIHLLQFNQPMPSNCLEAIQFGIQDLRASRSLLTEKHGKPPLMYKDVVALLDSIPDIDYFKPTECLLYLLALYTGARAITCANIKVGHITSIQTIGEDLQVKLLLCVAKAKPQWNHTVCFRDHKKSTKTDNIIHWLQVVLEQRFNLSLNDDFSLTEAQQATFLFPWSKNNLTQRLQNRLKHFGYPQTFFGFHSLRAGFACSTLTQRSEHQQAFLELSALVAGWVPSQPAQLGYIKDTTKSLIIANYLIQPEAPNPIDLTLPAHGYSTTLVPVAYPARLAYFSFQQALRYRLSSFPQPDQDTLFKNGLKLLLRHFGLTKTKKSLHARLAEMKTWQELSQLVEAILDQLPIEKQWHSLPLSPSPLRV